MSVTVTALGSCRVRRALKSLQRQGLVEMDDTGVYAVTHCSKEVLQLLRSMAGELIVPTDLRPFMVARSHYERIDDPEFRLNDLSNTDLLLIELSSAKELLFRGFYLQLVYTRNLLWHERPTVRAWWRHWEHDGTDVMDRASVIASADLSSAEAAVIAEIELRKQRLQDVRSDIGLIGERYRGPILFVTHFDTPTPTGGPNLPDRAPFIAAVRKAADELGYRTYDPSADVLAYADRHGGMSTAIDNMGHYTAAFVQDVLIERIHSEILAAVRLAPVG